MESERIKVTLGKRGDAKEKYHVRATIELQELFIKDDSPTMVKTVKKIGGREASLGGRCVFEEGKRIEVACNVSARSSYEKFRALSGQNSGASLMRA
jgi:hypothetical protein